MTDYWSLPIGDKAPHQFHAVVEVPKGSQNKYEYDKRLNIFKLNRTLYSPVHYPGDYGFIPSTLADDGDPLDVLVLVDEPSFPGCVLVARPIGLLDMVDEGEPDEKVLAVPVNNPRYDTVQAYGDILPHMLREIEHFFRIYKELEGKTVVTNGWRDATAAMETIRRCHERFVKVVR
ncbi:Inorganic pyrophosphatase [bacterium HR17]|uniref:Inorganic pyrophosphatase n=1 Tax=Candidatus Fervidibacter japonicus TaxID=2035412 RepID=A0A2H5XCG5_9BACT|nr:Inorganic pyrophosphatase [bacterium HR17]